MRQIAYTHVVEQRRGDAIIVQKPVKCRLCNVTIDIVNKKDKEGFQVVTGWESLRDHWDNEHPEDMAVLQNWLDAEV